MYILKAGQRGKHQITDQEYNGYGKTDQAKYEFAEDVETVDTSFDDQLNAGADDFDFEEDESSLGDDDEGGEDISETGSEFAEGLGADDNQQTNELENEFNGPDDTFNQAEGVEGNNGPEDNLTEQQQPEANDVDQSHASGTKTAPDSGKAPAKRGRPSKNN